MSDVNRRGFFATALGALAAGLSRPWWMRGVEPHTLGSYGCIAPGTVVSVPDGLMFHKDVFAMAMEPITAVEGRGEELFVVSGGAGYIIRADGGSISTSLSRARTS